MYFNNKSKTNIDDEFENESILSKIIQTLNKYKTIIIVLIVLAIIIVLMLLLMNKKTTNYLILNGEENITLYQGMDYIEPGFDAYNSKDEDLTNDVIINYDVDTNKVGEYVITYKIGEVTKTRKVTIIEKPDTYTSIYLKPVNNSINIYLKIGEKYEEPGYQVFSSNEENLTDKVEVTGTINTSKKGNYKLTYSVTDQNGVTITATRLVIVMDTEISLSLNNNEPTNKDITINIGIIDNYFDYIILPDGNKITESTYSYKVTKNGKYTFKVYNIKGTSKESSIEVKNIDKTAPTGACSGYYKDGISSINITASDESGIIQYEINGLKYQTNKITINKEIQTINATIYDKAGNTKNITCNLENKNESTSKPSTSSNSIDNIYTSSNSHTNSINGVRYLLYNQTDSRWSSVKYSSGKTIGEIGCMITSVAVVSSAYDNTITPKTVFDKYSHSYPYNSINNLADEGFDCKSLYAGNSKDKILTALKEGKVVVIMVYGKNKDGSSRFTSSQHYMALLDYNSSDDKIFIGNSYSSSGYGKSGWFDKDTVLTSVREVNICTPTQSLIDKFK